MHRAPILDSVPVFDAALATGAHLGDVRFPAGRGSLLLFAASRTRFVPADRALSTDCGPSDVSPGGPFTASIDCPSWTIILAAVCLSEDSAYNPLMRQASRVTVVIDDRFLDHDTGGGDHPEAPERITSVRNRLRRGTLAEQLEEVAPREAARCWIETAHDAAYLFRFEEAALSGKSFLDHPDNQICLDSYQIATLSAGSGLTGVDLLETGKASCVFCCSRPPGHHAERSQALGFCFFNNAAIAARYWQEVYGRKKILICDWDAHHGNGIQAAFEQDPSILYVSIHEHPTFSFPGTGLAEEIGSGGGSGATLNVPLPPGADDGMLLTALAVTVEPMVVHFQPDAVVVAAGFDGHQLDDMSRLAYSTRVYGRLGRIMADWAKRFCNSRVLSILEGGYHLEALAASVEMYLLGLAEGLAADDPC